MSWDKLPSAWLMHFSHVVKSTSVRRLMINKRFRKELTRNSAWLVQCEDLKDFQELTEYERYTMIQEEGFWYEWYNEHCDRYVPLSPPSKMFFKGPDNLKEIWIPSVGSIGWNVNILSVCIKIEKVGGKSPNAELPGKISWAPTILPSIGAVSKKKQAVTKLDGIIVSTLRTYGNYSVEITLVAPDYYK